MIDTIISWLLAHGTRIVIILIVGFIISRFVKIFITRTIKKALRKGLKIEIEVEREKTILRSFTSVVRAGIWIAIFLMVLSELGVNITPLIAGLGVLGLALGLGARSLIQDYLSGMFILLEDHYRVGENVEIAGIKGKVSDFNLRRTVIKDDEDNVYFIPNAQVKKASNFSRK